MLLFPKHFFDEISFLWCILLNLLDIKVFLVRKEMKQKSDPLMASVRMSCKKHNGKNHTICSTFDFDEKAIKNFICCDDYKNCLLKYTTKKKNQEVGNLKIRCNKNWNDKIDNLDYDFRGQFSNKIGEYH